MIVMDDQAGFKPAPTLSSKMIVMDNQAGFKPAPRLQSKMQNGGDRLPAQV
jgi:hypothetical protein